MRRCHEDVGAILFECTDLSPFADNLRCATGVHAFDAVAFVNLIRNSLSNIVGLYGDLQGGARLAMQEIESLDVLAIAVEPEPFAS